MEKPNLDELAKLVTLGDKRAYAQLLAAAALVVRGYVYARVTGRDRQIVEDVVQETLLAVHTKYQSYDPTLPFLPWLRTVAHHKLVDYWRRQKIAFLVSIDDEDAPLDIANIIQAEDHSNAALSLERLFEKLNDKQRRIVQLAKLDGKTMVEIADELSITVADAKVTLHRAILKLSDIAQNDNKERAGHAHG